MPSGIRCNLRIHSKERGGNGRDKWSRSRTFATLGRLLFMSVVDVIPPHRVNGIK